MPSCAQLLLELLHLQLDLVEAQSQGGMGGSCIAEAVPPTPAPPSAAGDAEAGPCLDMTIKLRFKTIDRLMAQLRQQEDGCAGVGAQAGPPAAIAAPAAPSGSPDLPQGFRSYAFVHTSLMQVGGGGACALMCGRGWGGCVGAAVQVARPGKLWLKGALL